jgi:hypothetical protein
MNEISKPIFVDFPPSKGNDWFVIDEMKACLRRHLQAARAECVAIATDLETIDADQLITDIDSNFCPLTKESRIQDNFSDAFHAALGELKNAGQEPITSRNSLPSGAQL